MATTKKTEVKTEATAKTDVKTVEQVICSLLTSASALLDFCGINSQNFQKFLDGAMSASDFGGSYKVSDGHDRDRKTLVMCLLAFYRKGISTLDGCSDPRDINEHADSRVVLQYSAIRMLHKVYVACACVNCVESNGKKCELQKSLSAWARGKKSRTGSAAVENKADLSDVLADL